MDPADVGAGGGGHKQVFARNVDEAVVIDVRPLMVALSGQRCRLRRVHRCIVVVVVVAAAAAAIVQLVPDPPVVVQRVPAILLLMLVVTHGAVKWAGIRQNSQGSEDQ